MAYEVMDEETTEVYNLLIDNARSLFDIDSDGNADLTSDVNPEYLRGIVETIIRMCGLTHTEDTEMVRRDLEKGRHIRPAAPEVI
jgi:hypothetical protein